MRILQVVPELNVGGVERGSLDLARELVKRGHAAFVVSNGGRLVSELERSGSKHICLPVHRKSLFSILCSIPRLADIIKKNNIEIVHARSRIPALIAFFAARRTGATFITTCHGHYSVHLLSRVMGWGKLVIYASEAIAQHMREDFGVPAGRLRYIPRGVDLENFTFKAPDQRKKKSIDEFAIGVIGRLTPIKGHIYFLQALAKVIRKVPRVKAFIVGDSSPGKEKYKEELRLLTRRLSLEGFVEFVGKEHNIPRVLSQLDLLVLPTVTQEAFGRVIIEAGACGVAVIATKVGGVVDIVDDGVNGALVAPKDSGALANAITTLHQDEKLRQRYAIAARKKVEKLFTLEQMTQKTITVYEEALKSKKILVIKLSALGDVILAVPTLRALRKKYPEAHISVLTKSEHVSVLRGLPYLDEIIGYSRSEFNIFQESRSLRKKHFDVILDLQNNRFSHLLAYLSGCNVRYGYNNGKLSFLLNKKIELPKEKLSPIKHQLKILSLLGIEKIDESLELCLRDEEEKWADNFLKNQSAKSRDTLIGLNVGSSIKWPTKQWKTQRISQFLDLLNKEGIDIILTGDNKDRKVLDELRALTKAPFIDAVGSTSVMQLAALIKRCKVYISSDSAPLHMAYAVKTPVIALFGPTDPRRHALDFAEQKVLWKDIACAPCYKRKCSHHSCMKALSADEVFDSLSELIKVSKS